MLIGLFMVMQATDYKKFLRLSFTLKVYFISNLEIFLLASELMFGYLINLLGLRKGVQCFSMLGSDL